jgi:hypothetical protein
MAFPYFLIVDLIAFATAGVFALSGAFITRCCTPEKSQKHLYEDKDGKSTEQSQKEYTTRIQAIIVTFCTFAGFAIALTDALLRNIPYGQSNEELNDGWLHVGIWVGPERTQNIA